MFSVGGLLVPTESSVYSLLVSLSVGNDREFWKNGRLDRDVVCGGILDGGLDVRFTLVPPSKYG